MENRKALIVIDVQIGMFDPNYPIFKEKELLEKIKNLISKARSIGTQVIYVQHNESVGEPLETRKPGWEIHPNIQPTEGDVIVQKTTPDSFHMTILQEELEKRSINELIITGLQTDMCIDATCQRAYRNGYKVTLVSDAHSTMDSNNLLAKEIIDNHNNELKRFANIKESREVFI
ncbi:cysteine hydrolase family protein [Paenibacillus crassostreae]|uniref:Isochorismatase n=1 Tax=Paenibacillus crassostreae TaxID=1763538 RepID=A0A167BWE0_9BACL|nr:cysteine hydrolase family protein [Paenibacillus crassostreae]AOZ92570.1 cysteine hydrolase [Paenibacillus crassostreae]OAB72519.1 isochorismatase [Paenibacillus crassostreae]